MPIVTSQLLSALTTNYRAVFNQALGDKAAMNEDWKAITTIIPSNTDKESLNWLGANPPMNEWKDKRQAVGLRDMTYTLTNAHYEATVGIDRDTIEDDKYNMFMPRIRGLAASAFKYMAEKVFSQIDDGETNTAYDGTAMFADTRTIGGSGNIDNLISMACSGSAAEIRAAVAAAQEKMRLFQDDWGKPMNLVPDTILCGPEMELALREAIFTPAVSQTIRPETMFVKRIIVSPWIDSDATDWYMLCTTEEIRPLVMILRKNPEFAAVTNPNDSGVFMDKTFYYGVDCRFAVGFGDPRTAVKLVDA